MGLACSWLPRGLATSLRRNATSQVRRSFAMGIISTPIIIHKGFHDVEWFVLDTCVISKCRRLLGHVCFGRRNIEVLIHGVGLCLFHLLVFIIRHILVVNPANWLANPIVIWFAIAKVPYIKDCCVGSMAGCHTPAALEYNLPDAVNV